MAGLAALLLTLAVGQDAPAPPPPAPDATAPRGGAAVGDSPLALWSCSSCIGKRDLALENRSGSEVRAIRATRLSFSGGGATSNFMGNSGGGAFRMRDDSQELLGGSPVADGARETVAVGAGFCSGSGFAQARVAIELADGRVIEKALDCTTGLVITAADAAGAKPPASPAPPPPRP